MRNQNAKAVLGAVFLAVVMGLLLFVPAGSVRYWQAWGYLIVFFGAAALITGYLMKNNPALLKRRVSGGPTVEKRASQKIIMSLASLWFVALLIVPALDFRFRWSSVPLFMVFVGNILIALGFWFVFLVFRENSFASSTIEVTPEQRVISTGPYALVRHPMYAGSFVYLLGTPFALGSCWGFVGMVFMLPAIVWRLFDEERFLAQDLPGYAAYCGKVRWRLIPGIF
jgi:protein-S-isoprenylcysteine O-methyltransferase Ste14